MSTDIALSDQMKKAEVMAASSLLPESYRKQPANLLWAMEMADALDVSLAQAITGISVIQGKPTMSAEMMRALVLRAGHRFTVTDMSDQAVTVTVARKGGPTTCNSSRSAWPTRSTPGWRSRPPTRSTRRRCCWPVHVDGVPCRVPRCGVRHGLHTRRNRHDDPVRTVNTARLTPQKAPEVTVEVVESASEVVEVDTETGEIVSESAPEEDILEAETVDELPKSWPKTSR